MGDESMPMWGEEVGWWQSLRHSSRPRGGLFGRKYCGCCQESRSDNEMATEWLMDGHAGHTDDSHLRQSKGGRTRFHCATQHGAQFKAYKLFISGTSHLMFSVCSWPLVTKTSGSKTMDKGGRLYILSYYVMICSAETEWRPLQLPLPKQACTEEVSTLYSAPGARWTKRGTLPFSFQTPSC